MANDQVFVSMEAPPNPDFNASKKHSLQECLAMKAGDCYLPGGLSSKKRQ